MLTPLPPSYDKCSYHVSNDCLNFQLFLITPKLYANDTDLRRAWTCEAIESYCSRMESIVSVLHIVERLQSLGGTGASNPFTSNVLAPISILCGLFLFTTSFFLKGRVFWFLKALAIGQIVQALNRTLNLRDFLPKIGNTFWRLFVQKATSDPVFYFAKTFSTSIAFFLALDRYLCVCHTLRYDKMNWNRYFVITLITSFLIASLQLLPIPLLLYDDSKLHDYYLSSSGGPWATFQTVWYPITFEPFLVAYQFAAIILCSAFSIRIIIVLKRRSCQVTSMTIGGQSKEKEKYTKFLCQIQMVDACALLIDLFGLVMFNLNHSTLASLVCTKDECLYPTPLTHDCTVRMSIGILIVISRTIDGTCHAELFILYLIFFRKFRLAFKKSWVVLYGKVKSLTTVMG